MSWGQDTGDGLADFLYSFATCVRGNMADGAPKISAHPGPAAVLRRVSLPVRRWRPCHGERGERPAREDWIGTSAVWTRYADRE